MKLPNTNHVSGLAEDWQRCRPERLPGAFFAYDDLERQSERVVTYRLDQEAMQYLHDTVPTKQGKPDFPPDFHFKIHLGLYKHLLTEDVPERPAFTLFLQALNNYPEKGHQLSDKDYAGSVELAWEKNSRFSETMATNTDSEANALSAAGAYLFVHSWMELPEENLADPFTAVSKVLGKRVRAYRFAHEESKSIWHDIAASLKGKNPALDVHLGNGLAVWAHPYSFRPVIEIKDVVNNGGEKLIERISGGAVNDSGDSFYDFGGPEPPPKQ